jgi:spermidine synthase
MGAQNSSPARHPWVLLGVVLVFFAVSGACGLLYQVVWTRKLVLLFGATAFAVSTVLSIFFFGLGLGSLWGGRWADRWRRPLFAYGVMEIIIGLWALAFIFAIDIGETALVALLQTVGHSRVLGIVTRALLAAALLIVPVTLMGATLPLLARFVTTGGQVRGRPIGLLYSMNTVGAVLGCAVTGFVLLATFGYTRTTLIGAALNVGVGVLAIAVSARYEPRRGDVPAQFDGVDPGRAGARPSLRFGAGAIVLAAFALSGFCSLALEVLWTRLLTIVFYGTTYAFTTMLTTVLIGIALGSAVAAWLVDRRRDPVGLFGVVQALTGIACLGMLYFFPALPDILIEQQRAVGFDWDRLVFRKFVLCALVIFPPTFLFGMSFPLAVRAYVTLQDHVGRDVGRLYSANTFGGVLGALAGGFLIIPALGVHNGIVVLAFAMLLMGLALILAAPMWTARIKPLYAVTAAAAALVLFVRLPGDVSLALNKWFVPDDHKIIHYAEGVEATVVVSAPEVDDRGTDRVLWLNAVQATASIEKGVKMNRFQGVLPLVFDRNPQEALFMCFGSGITAGTLALSPFERIDTVEIAEDVLQAAQFFKVDNFDVLNNSRIRAIVDDGRNFLLTTSHRYDLITFEPMPLALAGVSTFYTREYYELCRKRLAPGGIVSQWVPIHSLNTDVVRSMMATFLAVFPEATTWFVNADLFLIGSEEPLRIDYAQLRQRIENNPELRAGLEAVYLPDVEEVLASFFMDRDAMQKFADGAPIMTDDRPWAEFVAPKLIYDSDVAESLKDLAPFRTSPMPLLINASDTEREAVAQRHRAHVHDLKGLQIYYNMTIGSEPEKYFRESLDIDPKNANARYYLSEILLQKGNLNVRWDEPELAEAQLLEAQLHAPHRLDILLALVDAYAEWDRMDEARRFYAEYREKGGTAERTVAPGL